MDWSENNLCIKCNEGTDLLVCSEMDCPLSIHEKCMSCPARFDDSGRFYCPYCLYKKAVAESRQAREYALAKKKALLVFMEEDMIAGEKQPKVNEGAEANNGHKNQLKVNETNVNITAHGEEENKVSGAENEKIPEDVPKISDVEEIRDEVREEASETSNSRDKRNPEEEIEISSGSSGLDSVSLRKRAESALKRRKTVHRDSEAVLAKIKYAEQINGSKNPSPNVNSPRRSSRNISPATKSPEEVKSEKVKVAKSPEEVKSEKVKISKRLRKNELPLVKLCNDRFSSGKRKRLMWREEEEEVLKAGVEKFMKEPTNQMPWRKILDMGRNVFDVSRTPIDLKDKWRNMSAK